MSQSVRPLQRLGPGVWKSCDGRWTFLRHHSDPHPQRWYAYEGEDDYPANDGSGITTLHAAVEWVIDEEARSGAGEPATAPAPGTAGAEDRELTPRGQSGGRAS